ncbi:hypothetical protein PIB30_106915, partial [Stylosanthes scabra]|nr:hypothetical protein [Stylosanthes scabra]
EMRDSGEASAAVEGLVATEDERFGVGGAEGERSEIWEKSQSLNGSSYGRRRVRGGGRVRARG